MKKRIVLVIVAVILILLEVAFIIYQKNDFGAILPEPQTEAAPTETTVGADSVEQTQTEGTEATDALDELPPIEFFAEGETAAPAQPQETSPAEQPATTEAAPVEEPDGTEETSGSDGLDENELPRIPF